MRKIFGLSAFAVFAITCLNNVSADVIYSQDFDTYTAGNIAGQDGWVAHSGANSNSIQVNATDGNFSMDGTGEDVSRAVGATMAAGDIWELSFDVIVNDVGSGSTYFAHFKDSGNGFNSRIFGLSAVAGGDFTFGISDTSGSSDANFATDFNFGQAYTLNAVYDFDTGLSTLTVDGVAGSISSATSDVGQAIQQIGFRQGSGGGDYIIDNVFVSAVPEPSSIALLGLLGLAGAVRRRR